MSSKRPKSGRHSMLIANKSQRNLKRTDSTLVNGQISGHQQYIQNEEYIASALDKMRSLVQTLQTKLSATTKAHQSDIVRNITRN